jgi:Ca2+-binding RTX toxin-like protein
MLVAPALSGCDAAFMAAYRPQNPKEELVMKKPIETARIGTGLDAIFAAGLSAESAGVSTTMDAPLAVPPAEAQPQLAPIAQAALPITIVGTNGNDILLGYTNDNVIFGLAGNDQLNGDYGNDTLYGGDGNDFLVGGHGDDVLDGGAGVDLLAGIDGIDTASYADAQSGVGVDLVNSSWGWGDAAGDVFIDIDIFQLSNYDDSFWGADGNDVVYGGLGNDSLYGNGGNDTLIGGAGNDVISGGMGADFIDGGDGVDTVAFGGADEGPLVVNLVDPTRNAGSAAGDVFVNIEKFQLASSNDIFVGSDGNDNVDGGRGDDIISGGAGDDILFGGRGFVGGRGNPIPGGNDVLHGGDGNDNLDGGDGDDYLDGGAGADILTGGDGFDTVSYADATAAVSIDLTKVSSAWTGDARGDVYSRIEQLLLSNFNDIFIGDANANVVKGGGGDDRISGGGGDDGLTGGDGNDLLQGGDGNDLMRGDGYASGPGNDRLFGNAGDDVLGGDGGSDTLDGGAGADALEGGDGYDTASYGDATSGVSINLTAASSSWAGDANGDSFTSIEAFDLTGFADVFRGDDADNTVISRAGDDQLFGGGGNDRLIAGTGNDILSGGLGVDVLNGEQGADIFKFFSVEESMGAVVNGVKQVDTVSDFTQGEDKIDLSAIDANGTLAGDQAFTFISDPASHTGDWTGLVWSVTDSRGTTTVFISTDGDADAEMQIYTPHAVQFNAGDFIL